MSRSSRRRQRRLDVLRRAERKSWFRRYLKALRSGVAAASIGTATIGAVGWSRLRPLPPMTPGLAILPINGRCRPIGRRCRPQATRFNLEPREVPAQLWLTT